MFNQRADTRSYKVLQRQKIENLTHPPTSPTNTFDREAIISPYPVVGVVIQVASGLQSAHMSLYEGLFSPQIPVCQSRLSSSEESFSSPHIS